MNQKSYIQQAKEAAKAEINQLNRFIKQCNEGIKQQNKTINVYENRIKTIESNFKKEFGQELK